MIEILQETRTKRQAQARVALGLLMLGIGLAIAMLPVKFALVAVAGAIVFLLTLIQPMYAFYLILLSVPFGSLAAITAGSVSITATDALVGTLLIAWVLRVVGLRKSKVRFTALFWPFVAYFAALILSSSNAALFELSLKEFAKWFEFGALYLAAVNMIEDRRQLQWLALGIVGVTVLEAFHGWYQFFRRDGPPSFLIGGRFLRAYGTFEQPNPYAGYLGLALPIAYGLSITGSLRPQSPKFLRTMVAVAAFGVILAAMLMSMSRGGWFGAAGALAVITAVKSRRSFFALVAASLGGIILILLGSLSLLPQQLVQRLTMVTDYFRIFDVRTVVLTPDNWAIVQRMAAWQSAWNILSDHPLLGVGIGNFPVAYYWYAMPNWGTPIGHAHNYYLNVGAETGIIGLITYLLMWIFAFGMAIRILRRFPYGWKPKAKPLREAATVASRDRTPREPTPNRFAALRPPDPRRASGVVPSLADFQPEIKSAGNDWSRNRPFAKPTREFWDASATWGMALGITGTLIALSIHNIFDNLYVHGMYAQIALSLGMLVAADKFSGDVDDRS